MCDNDPNFGSINNRTTNTHISNNNNSHDDYQKSDNNDDDDDDVLAKAFNDTLNNECFC